MRYFLQQMTVGSDVIPLRIKISDDDDNVIVGRQHYSDLHKYPLVSRSHASFLKSDDGALFVKDLSLNGVYVNGTKIGKNLHKLQIGDKIGLGVPSASDGFVCILCTDTPPHTVKHEVIEISDDDEPSNFNEVVSKQVKSQEPVCSILNKANHIKTEVIQAAEILQSQSLQNSNLQPVNTPLNLPDPQNSKNLTNANQILNNTDFKNYVSRTNKFTGSESSEVSIVNNKGNTAKFQGVDYSKLLEGKKCCVHLIRIDSKYFQWPPDVKSLRVGNISQLASKNEEFQRKKISIWKRKRTMHISSSEDEASDTSLPPSKISVISQQSCSGDKDCHTTNILRSKNVTSFCISISDDEVPDDASAHASKMPHLSSKIYENNKLDFKHPLSSSEVPHLSKICKTNDASFSTKNFTGLEEAQISENKDLNKVDLRGKFGTKFNDVESKTAFVIPMQQSSCSNEFGYSQVEEVIYLSDGDNDEYLDFNSSQNAICPKTEPPDDVDEDDYNNIFAGELQNEIALDVPGNSDGKIESVETIAEYVKATGNNTLTEKPSLPRLEAGKNSDFFPILSQGFDDDSDSKSNSSVESDSKILYASQSYAVKENSDMNANSKTTVSSKVKAMKPVLHISQNSDRKSSGKTLFTEPKPMSYRPKKIRGRGEWFFEHNTHTDSTASGSTKLKTKKSKSRNKDTISKTSPCKNQKGQKTSKKSMPQSVRTVLVQNKSESLQNYRIPKKSDKNKDTDAKEIAKSIKETVQNNKSAFTQAQNILNRKGPSVKRRPENYGSRLGSLVSAMQDETPKIKSKPKNKINNAKIHREAKRPVISKPETVITNATNKSFQGCSVDEPKDIYNKIVPNSVLFQNSGKHPINIRDPRTFRGQRSVSVNKGNEMPYLLSDKTSKATAVISPSPHASASSINPVETKHSKSFAHINFFILLERILNMQVSWLQEQQKLKFPPPEVSKGARSLPLYYESFTCYISSICPMIMLEIWDTIYQESRPILESQRTVNKFYFSVQSYNLKNGMIELSCKSVVNDKVSYSPREGTLIILDIKSKNRDVYPMFGFITSHKVDELKIEAVSRTEWRKLPSEWMRDAKQWAFSVYIRKKDFNIELSKIMKANGICYLKSKLRIAEALHYLKSSKLLNDILQPNENTFSVELIQSSPSSHYSTSQKQAILSISSVIRRPVNESKIILLQGPPGTGKTHTIVGLLENLINRHKSSLKILVTAPSNAAIDEIGCRLIESKERSSWRDRDWKFVRIGQTRQMNEKMLPYSLEEKAAALYKETWRNETKYKEKEVERIKAELKEETKKLGGCNSDTYKNLKERLEYLLNYRELETRWNYSTQMNYKIDVLKDANIVLSTLNSCRQSILTRVFKPNSSCQFSCCIVDEATQCTEPEVLQPLTYGINKLILIGDHQQLPATVNSKEAVKCGFERSLFERFHLYFMSKTQKSPILMLTQQFRMHSEICHFPSKYFYQGNLFTPPDIDIRKITFPLRPYIVLDILQSQELSALSSKANYNEAEVIVHICSQLLQMNTTTSIGIITPYQGQKSLYTTALSPNPNYKDIEVNTVDSFQGREKDVIIVSCVRANSPSGGIGFLACKKRLNVAITRARQCLIICGHISSLIQNPDWRALIYDARERNLCISITSPKDIPIIFNRELMKQQ